MIARGMDFFLRYFPDCDCDSALIREYNRRMVADYEEIRDFIVLPLQRHRPRRFAFLAMVQEHQAARFIAGANRVVQGPRCAARGGR